MPPLHTEVDLGAATTGTFTIDSNQDFEVRSRRLDTAFSVASLQLQKANAALTSDDATPARVAPYVQRLEAATTAIRRDLAQLAEKNKAAANDKTVGSSSLRIRVTRFSKHAKEFSALLTEFENTREAYRLLLDGGIRAGISQVEPGLSAGEVDEAMRREGGLDKVLERARPELKWQVQDLRERNKELAKLNRDVASLHEMFVELSFLTENQQGLINEIEHNVEHVKGDVKKADEEIIEAHRYRKAARKKMIIIAAIILLIIAIVVIVVVLQVT